MLPVSATHCRYHPDGYYPLLGRKSARRAGELRGTCRIRIVTWLILAVSTAVGLWLLVNGFMNSNPAVLVRVLRGLGVGALAVLLLYLMASGRLSWLFSLAGLLPLLSSVRRYFGRSSRRSTSLVEMSFDARGQPIGGTILAGIWQGRTLSSLPQEVLLGLIGEWRFSDPQSAGLLESWLTRSLQPSGAMTEAIAYEVLGLSPGAAAVDISAAHRRLISKLHPDCGGSNHLAAQINQARDLLLHR